MIFMLMNTLYIHDFFMAVKIMHAHVFFYFFEQEN